MGKTKVVNVRRSPFDVYVGRARLVDGQTDGTFGNPFHIEGHSGDPAARALCINKYAEYFIKRVMEDAEFSKRVDELKGKILGCHCKPLVCHGDVIAEWVDKNRVRTLRRIK